MGTAAIGLFLGTVLGSFAMAAADRLIYKKSIKGRSYCLSCKHNLRWYDLFPVFSYLFLKGRCRYCKKRIPPGNLLGELVMGILIAILFYLSLPADLSPFLNFNLANVVFFLELLFKTFLIVVFVIVFVIDFKTGLIHDRLTIPATILAVLFLIIIAALKSWYFYAQLQGVAFGKYLMPPYSSYLFDHLQRIWQPLLWALISGLVSALVFILLIIVTKGRGMGWGDVKYVLFLGFALGFPYTPLALFLAFLIGAIFSLGLIAVRRKNFGQTIPFGPFLSLGALIALLWGNQIINFYLGFRV